MALDRQVLAVDGCDQWVRAAHQSTAVGAGGVTLSWSVPDVEMVAVESAPGEAHGRCDATGLEFDRFCRAYVVVGNTIERVRLGPTAAGVDYARVPPPTDLFAVPATTTEPGSFGPTDAPTGQLAEPRGVGVDADDRLVIAERGARRITFVDLWQRRTIRLATTTTAARPLRAPIGLAVDGRDVWVVTEQPTGLLRLTARRGPFDVDLPLPAPAADPADALPADAVAVRITVLAGRPVLLFRDPTGECWLVAAGVVATRVGPASEVAVADGGIVVAPCGGGRFLVRYVVVNDTWQREAALDAQEYDGRGIAVSTDGRIAYTTADGIRLAVGTRVRYEAEGRVVTYRLDSGRYGAQWGRVFVDACVPPGTDVRYAIRTSDDEFVTEIARTPALPELCPAPTTASPVLPPPSLDVAVPAVDGRFHTRRDHPAPWWRHRADQAIVTLEGFADAKPGRYAWVTLRLLGGTRSSPVVRSLRIEAESHTMARRLPKVFTRDDDVAFLHRFLALFDGMLHDLDARALHRELLVDPASTPEEALPWLASFLGMVLDNRWPVADRRQLVSEAAWLYRRRGTLAALQRYLAIYLHVDPVILEHHRMRGAGGPIVGTDAIALSSRSVIGFGLRVGGALGDPDSEPLEGDAASAFARLAHRFSVLVPRPLDEEQEAVVRHILDTERPAHTAYELCTVDAGLRVGVASHLALSTVIGRTGGFTPIVLDRGVLGVDGILGRPVPGAVAEAGRVGLARVG